MEGESRVDTIYRVFVSSTYEDLKEERRAVTQALLEMNCFPAGMELFQASNDNQWELIKKVIDSCDYYIIIIAGRYGTIHKDFNKSYTQMEFEYALQVGLPILGFVHEDIDGLPANKIDDLKRVKEFVEIVKSRHVRFWSDAKELSGIVSRAMHNVMNENPRPGWVRDPQIHRQVKMAEMLEQVFADQNIARAFSSMVMGKSDATSKGNSGSRGEKDSNEDIERMRREKSTSSTTGANISGSFVEYNAVFELDMLKESQLNELINCVGSLGITAFSNFFSIQAGVGFPSFHFLETSKELRSFLNEQNSTCVLYRFMCKNLSGYFAIDMNNIFLTDFYTRHVRECGLNIFSKSEIRRYKNSMYSELGSLFCGACASQLAEFLGERIDIVEVEIRDVGGGDDVSLPLFAGEFPFLLDDTEFKFYLLLDIEQLKLLLFAQNNSFERDCLNYYLKNMKIHTI